MLVTARLHAASHAKIGVMDHAKTLALVHVEVIVVIQRVIRDVAVVANHAPLIVTLHVVQHLEQGVKKL